MKKMHQVEPRFGTSTNFRLKAYHMETPVGPSETKPDQAITMRQIYTRFAQGRGPGVGAMPQLYTGDEQFPDVRKLDLVEVQDLMSSTRERIATLKASSEDQLNKLRILEAEKKAKHQAAEDARILALVKAAQQS